ncbi:hypothetical protein [Paenibacillus dakarensis]|uniref:hypothetical protein n=1 Tax=Paenibacillus dakarensis TaxID=1527293 RepID=UPI0006D54BB4|nr:hypothetical protein [Paenibacillus dakarensis]
MSTIALGPLMIRADLLAFIISAVTGYIVLKMRLRGREESHWITDVYTNALIIGFVAWKFGMIVFDLVRTIQNPLSLLYLTGGDKGILLGTALALLYIGFQLNRKRSLTIPLLKASALAFLAASSARYALLGLWLDTSGWDDLLYVLLHAIFAVIVWLKFDSSIRYFNSLALWYSIGSVFIRFFDPDRDIVIAGLSAIQIVYVIMAIILLASDMIINKPKQDNVG